MKTLRRLSPVDKATWLATVAADKKAADILVLDVSHYASITDYMLLATMESSVQLRAVAEAMEKEIDHWGGVGLRREGSPRSLWMILDVGSVVVHLMGPEERNRYRLEELWGGGQTVVFHL